MIVKIIKEAGYEEALLGLSLSFNTSLEKMPQVAAKLAGKGGGHDKFMESIVVWLDISAPRYWWQQFDAYRIGVTKQSESTMHTILKRPLTEKDFTEKIDKRIIEILNEAISKGDFEKVKANLPESFLQRRIVCTNYKVLYNIMLQRWKHKLEEWQYFHREILKQIKRRCLFRDFC